MKSKTCYGFDQSAGIPLMAIHTFQVAPDGQLEHIINGRLRATVPPEGWADYATTWPDAQSVIDALRIDPVVSVNDQLAAALDKINALQQEAGHVAH